VADASEFSYVASRDFPISARRRAGHDAALRFSGSSAMARGNRKDDNWQPTQRPLRWYEWLLILLLMLLAGGVRAATVYKCTAANGDIAYQSLPCMPEQHSQAMDLGRTPAVQPSPSYAVERRDDTVSTRDRGQVRHAERAPREPMAYECRASDGEVFYRHTSCPRSIGANAQTSRGASGPGARSAGSSGRGAGGSVSVSSRRVTRAEACHEIHSAGAIGRPGHEHDDDVSTYDRNLGRDPCR